MPKPAEVMMYTHDVESRKPARPITTYADKKNSEYWKKDSHYVTLRERLNEVIQTGNADIDEYWEMDINNAITEFKRNHPKIKSSTQLKMVKALQIDMSKILIDVTIQRPLDLSWALKIIKNFLETKLRPIDVYEDPDKPGYYICWNGQHTVEALYIIFTKIFGEDIAGTMIPVNIYPACRKAEIRDAFIGHNSGEDSKELTQFDLYRQKLYGVRVDKSENPKWVDAEKKQCVLEKYKMFATEKDADDVEENGALTRLDEINNPGIWPESVDHFCNYFRKLGQERAIDPKEAVMMFWFWKQCRIEPNVKVDEKYVADVTHVIKELFDGDFSPAGKFWSGMTAAYHNWHAEHYKDYPALGMVPPAARPSSEVPHGATYLIAQLKHNLPKLNLPDYKGTTEFHVLTSDLKKVN